MTTEDSDNRFVERRSAHLDDPAAQAERAAESPAATEPAAAEPITAEPPARGPSRPVESPATAAPDEAALELDEMARVEVPEPTFYEIAQPLEIQALQFLGELPLTPEGEKRTLPNWAKHTIDLLGILEERTRGNLTQDEAQYLERVLADLRMRFVRVAT